MSRAPRFCRGSPSALAGGLLCFAALVRPLAAQDTVRGRIQDAAGRGVAGSEVTLHRVTVAGGAAVARSTTDTQGRFALVVPETSEDAIYFVATRSDGKLYLGDPFRAPFPPAAEYVITLATAAAPVRSGASLAAALLLLAALAATAGFWWRGRGELRLRAALLALARHDEDQAAHATSEAGEYRRARAALLARVRSLRR